VNADLERLFAADEEGRARLTAARAEAAGALDRARRNLEEERTARLSRLEAALEQELAGIRAEAEEAARARARRRAEFRQARRQASEALLPGAVEAFVRIVLEGPGKEA